MPVSFFFKQRPSLQHISSCRAAAISIPLVRLRCSEQRITGVVNKRLPRSRRRFYCTVFFPKPLSVHNSLLSLSLSLSPSPSRRGRQFLLLLVTLQPSRGRIPSAIAKIVIIGIRGRTSACTAMPACGESGKVYAADDRSRKTRSGLCALAGNGAS